MRSRRNSALPVVSRSTSIVMAAARGELVESPPTPCARGYRAHSFVKRHTINNHRPMITISMWRSFEWKTLTLRWHASCADPGLTPRVAIEKAGRVLAESYLAVIVSPNENAIHFRRSWFNARTILTRGPSGSSWLGWLLRGRVAATGGDGKVTVEASGSMALLFLLPALICALVWFR